MVSSISSGVGISDGMSRLTSALQQNANRLSNKSAQLKSDTTSLADEVTNKSHEFLAAAQTYRRNGEMQRAQQANIGSHLNVTA